MSCDRNSKRLEAWRRHTSHLEVLLSCGDCGPSPGMEPKHMQQYGTRKVVVGVDSKRTKKQRGTARGSYRLDGSVRRLFHHRDCSAPGADGTFLSLSNSWLLHLVSLPYFTNL
ncbi:hypothetical protein IF1G_10358 [Cordyceps javanica]|uniref:Uncharacterized protein n=1 Tax=Cordyceps javanica TaxID=43265 RepID=A0A545UNV1_9HYPO|nr:hypothetical protein IF1G_10358 [Cordyceps javanica]